MKKLSAFLSALIIGGVLAGGAVQAQDTSPGPAVSVPIVFVGAERREAPAELMRGLFNDSARVIQDGNVDVVDAVFSVKAEELMRLAPSLQPRLFVGLDYYEVLNVEYENWDQVKSQPIDDSKPVGQTHFYHFLIPMVRAENIKTEQPVFLTTLTLQDLVPRAGEELFLNTLREINPGLAEHSIRLDPEQLIK